jgi:hypothetical protein
LSTRRNLLPSICMRIKLKLAILQETFTVINYQIPQIFYMAKDTDSENCVLCNNTTTYWKWLTTEISPDTLLTFFEAGRQCGIDFSSFANRPYSAICLTCQLDIITSHRFVEKTRKSLEYFKAHQPGVRLINSS